MEKSYRVVNPYSGELLGEYRYTEGAEVAEIVDRLKAGRAVQRATPAYQRSEVLRHLAQLLQQNSERLAQLVTAETGKAIADSRVELARAVNTTVASSEEARQIVGEALDSDAYPPTRSRMGVVCFRPLGTVLCITPYNFPLNIAMHKIGPAYAAGNCILFKPNPQNAASAIELTQLCRMAGISDDVLQMCVPELDAMGALVAHPDINCINFTGGNVAADRIAAASGYKKLLLELGGNDPLIVMADADLDAAVRVAINQRFATAGQRCTACKRVYVHADVYQAFSDELVAQSRKLVVGDPTDEATFVGPLINSAAADEVESRIVDAVESGARVLLGNRREGNIIYPCILEDVPPDARLIRCETFGPVLPLQRFGHMQELVEAVNRSGYGLQAGVFTRDLETIRTLFEELEVGTLITNDGPGFRAEHFPFGGMKASGIGREGVKYAMREMSCLKTLVI